MSPNRKTSLNVPAPRAKRPGLRILYLEDDPHDVMLLRRALAKTDFRAEIHPVADPGDYKSAVEQTGYDLLLSDTGLPGLSGLQALEIAKQKCPSVPFVFLSGNRDENKIKAGLKAGADDYVLKGDNWQLVQMIRRLIAIKRLKQENANLVRLNQTMARLVDAVQELSLARGLESIMTVVRRTARQLTGADGATFVLRDGDMCHYADEDAIAPLWKGQRFPMNACISGWTMLNRQPAIIEDIYADPRIPTDAYRPTFVKSLVMVPIGTSAPIGAIGNYWAHKHLASREEVDLLQGLANTTAVAMENVQAYDQLEQRVKERTAQLKSTNEELEAFTYSVSHDLRAPLRHIAGFVTILEEDHGETLNEKVRELLVKIQVRTQVMSTMMEDLLRLSKISRAELAVRLINLSPMVQEIASRLSLSAPERLVTWHIPDRIEARVDPGLIELALENLVSNSWKYTSRRPKTHIEFGVRTPDHGPTQYYVRDNGAGFDMQLADKLFQPFSRMHRQTEFPGSGIGLATVRRIIERHGGSIWAESAVEQGSTFYFTLSP
jgi:signal transduction histidine kinase/CheY-like chemotaxis protein